MAWSIERARAEWARGQGLVGRGGSDLPSIVANTGWIRTLGGAEAYLALAARAEGVTVDGVHRAVARRELRVSPSVRGCIYLVPAADSGISLRIADQLSRRRTARDLEKAGVEPAELEAVGESVIEALGAGPASTRALGKALPDGVVRSLGPAGKKVGLSTTLPPALRQLELAGRLVRTPKDSRLDHERYVWSLPADDPLADTPETDEAVAAALAERFVRWAGPVTRDELAAWSGLGRRASKKALEDAGAVAIEVEGLGQAWVAPDRVDAPSSAPTALSWLPAMDNLLSLHADSGPLVHPAGHDVEVPIFGYGGPKKLAEVNVPLIRTLTRGGQVVGLWDYDSAHPAIEARFFDGLDFALKGADEVAQLLRDLGHGKVTSIDNAKGEAKRLAAVRAL